MWEEAAQGCEYQEAFRIIGGNLQMFSRIPVLYRLDPNSNFSPASQF